MIKTFNLDVEIIKRLKQVDNASGLINSLLKRHFRQEDLQNIYQRVNAGELSAKEASIEMNKIFGHVSPEDEEIVKKIIDEINNGGEKE